MRILVISDTHGRHENLKKIRERERDIDRVIHLGDVEGGESYIEELVGCPVEIVEGNNDFIITLPWRRKICGKRPWGAAWTS